ncbi:hypothetical protein [Nonomuraea rhodomycinica]|uniref:Uncharacterized protein n=1 Tax=Nonomuraea rhodomycinica TaxID=1712872 RepID=A0A7Y6IJL3_9ACTN|nr:hypothetical protein [Nonomuraea rhodomycinica]NUW39342.1 hypothetical protein [Nonomuraea rhodomycinica]
MTAAKRLVTFVDVDGQAADTVSVSARHEVELADGTRVLLLHDRGWGSSQGWAATSVADVQDTTRTVVGPDEPFGGRSQEDMEADHWALLQRIAQRQGVVVDAATLRRLPHDVVLSPQVLARIEGYPDPASG